MTDTKITAATNTTTLLSTDSLPLAVAGDTTARRVTMGTLRAGSYNARDYGAVGDGATNDAAAIQAAITAALASGGYVYAPPGTYNLGTTPLTIDGRLGGFVGAGPNETIFTYTGTSAAIKVNSGGGLTTDSCVLRDFQVDCLTIGAYGIQYGQQSTSPKSANVTTFNVWVSGAATACFRLNTAQLCSWYECWALNSAGDGFWLEPASTSSNTTCRFFGCRAKTCKRGWYIQQGVSTDLYSCTAELNTQEGVYVLKSNAYALKKTVLQGCHFEKNNNGRGAGGYAHVLVDCETAVPDVCLFNNYYNTSGTGNHDVRVNQGIVEILTGDMVDSTNSVYLGDSSSVRLRMSTQEDPSTVLTLASGKPSVQALQWGNSGSPYVLWVNNNGTLAKMIEIADGTGGNKIGFFAATPIAKPTGVAVTAAGVHAALVSLGLIAA